MNFCIKRVRIERVRIASARPILSKRFWIAAILFQRWAFSSLPVRFLELKAFLSCMLPCVGEVQSCVRNSATLLPRICWSFARRRWTPTQLGQILLCQQHVDVATPEIRSLPGWIFEGTHSPEERDRVWGGATRWRSFWDTILELLPRCRATVLFPDWEDEHNLRHFRVSPMRKAANAWVSCIRTVRPRFKRARLENVVVWPWFSRSEKILWLKSARF